MKKFIFLSFITLLLSSCVTVKPPYTQFSNTIDFSEYTRKGFFITESNSVSFSYDPLGSISSVVQGGYEVLGSKKRTSDDEVYGTNSNVKYGKFINASIEDALYEMYTAARKLGANAIINFKQTYIPASFVNNIYTPSSYVVSGMAVRKKH